MEKLTFNNPLEKLYNESYYLFNTIGNKALISHIGGNLSEMKDRFASDSTDYLNVSDLVCGYVMHDGMVDTVEKIKRKEQICSAKGRRISSVLIKDAIAHIFNIDEQYIVELIVNGFDAQSDSATVGKFGMGFFSSLTPLNKIDGLEMNIYTKFRKKDSGDIESYHIKLKIVDGELKFRLNEYPADAPSLPDETGTTVQYTFPTELDSTSLNSVFEEAEKLRYYRKGSLYFSSNVSDINDTLVGATKSVDTRDYKLLNNAEFILPDHDEREVYVIVDKNMLQITDKGRGISSDILLQKLLVPASSTKGMIQETNGEGRDMEESIILYDETNKTGVYANTVQFNRLLINVGGVNVFKGKTKIHTDETGSDYLLDLELGFNVPVARNDVLLNTDNDFAIIGEHLTKLISFIATDGDKDLIKLENLMNTYHIYTTQKRASHKISQIMIRIYEKLFRNTIYLPIPDNGILLKRLLPENTCIYTNMMNYNDTCNKLAEMHEEYGELFMGKKLVRVNEVGDDYNFIILGNVIITNHTDDISILNESLKEVDTLSSNVKLENGTVTRGSSRDFYRTIDDTVNTCSKSIVHIIIDDIMRQDSFRYIDSLTKSDEQIIDDNLKNRIKFVLNNANRLMVLILNLKYDNFNVSSIFNDFMYSHIYVLIRGCSTINDCERYLSHVENIYHKSVYHKSVASDYGIELNSIIYNLDKNKTGMPMIIKTDKSVPSEYNISYVMLDTFIGLPINSYDSRKSCTQSISSVTIKLFMDKMKEATYLNRHNTRRIYYPSFTFDVIRNINCVEYYQVKDYVKEYSSPENTVSYDDIISMIDPLVSKVNEEINWLENNGIKMEYMDRVNELKYSFFKENRYETYYANKYSSLTTEDEREIEMFKELLKQIVSNIQLIFMQKMNAELQGLKDKYIYIKTKIRQTFYNVNSTKYLEALESTLYALDRKILDTDNEEEDDKEDMSNIIEADKRSSRRDEQRKKSRDVERKRNRRVKYDSRSYTGGNREDIKFSYDNKYKLFSAKLSEINIAYNRILTLIQNMKNLIDTEKFRAVFLGYSDDDKFLQLLVYMANLMLGKYMVLKASLDVLNQCKSSLEKSRRDSISVEDWEFSLSDTTNSEILASIRSNLGPSTKSIIYKSAIQFVTSMDGVEYYNNGSAEFSTFALYDEELYDDDGSDIETMRTDKIFSRLTDNKIVYFGLKRLNNYMKTVHVPTDNVLNGIIKDDTFNVGVTHTSDTINRMHLEYMISNSTHRIEGIMSSYKYYCFFSNMSPLYTSQLFNAGYEIYNLIEMIYDIISEDNKPLKIAYMLFCLLYTLPYNKLIRYNDDTTPNNYSIKGDINEIRSTLMKKENIHSFADILNRTTSGEINNMFLNLYYTIANRESNKYLESLTKSLPFIRVNNYIKSIMNEPINLPNMDIDQNIISYGKNRVSTGEDDIHTDIVTVNNVNLSSFIKKIYSLADINLATDIVDVPKSDLGLQIVPIAVNSGSPNQVELSVAIEFLQNSIDATDEIHYANTGNYLRDWTIRKDISEFKFDTPYENYSNGSNVDVRVGYIKRGSNYAITYENKDYIGFDKLGHIISLIVPYYSEKSTGTGQMGNGFFNAYRNSVKVHVRSRKHKDDGDNVNFLITDIPVYSQGLVMDINKDFTFYHNDEGKEEGNFTSVMVEYNPMNPGEFTFNANMLNIEIASALSSVPYINSKLNGISIQINEGSADYILLHASENIKVFYKTGETKSYVLTHGVPFMAWDKFADKYNISYPNIHYLMNKNIIIDISNEKYMPVQSRIDAKFDDSAIDEINSILTTIIFTLNAYKVMNEGEKPPLIFYDFNDTLFLDQVIPNVEYKPHKITELDTFITTFQISEGGETFSVVKFIIENLVRSFGKNICNETITFYGDIFDLIKSRKDSSVNMSELKPHIEAAGVVHDRYIERIEESISTLKSNPDIKAMMNILSLKWILMKLSDYKSLLTNAFRSYALSYNVTIIEDTTSSKQKAATGGALGIEEYSIIAYMTQLLQHYVDVYTEIMLENDLLDNAHRHAPTVLLIETDPFIGGYYNSSANVLVINKLQEFTFLLTFIDMLKVNGSVAKYTIRTNESFLKLFGPNSIMTHELEHFRRGKSHGSSGESCESLGSHDSIVVDFKDGERERTFDECIYTFFNLAIKNSLINRWMERVEAMTMPDTL